MNDLAELEAFTGTLFDFQQAIVEISSGDLTAAAVLNLNDKDRIDVGIVLFIAILCPMLPLVFPFIRCRLKHSHIVVHAVGIGDNDSVFQQTGRTDFIGAGNNSMSSGSDILREAVETLRSSSHADHDRHSGQTVIGTAFEELLHDRCGAGGIASLHTTVSFINDEVQVIRFFADGIGEGFPNGIGTSIAMLHKVAAASELLRIEEIYLAIFQHFRVKGIVGNRDALVKVNLIGFEVDFILRLLIEFGRIGEPHKNGIQLIGIKLIAVEDVFDKRRHDDRLTGTGRSSIGNDLRSVRPLITAAGFLHLNAEVLESYFLKRE